MDSCIPKEEEEEQVNIFLYVFYRTMFRFTVPSVHIIRV